MAGTAIAAMMKTRGSFGPRPDSPPHQGGRGQVLPAVQPNENWRGMDLWLPTAQVQRTHNVGHHTTITVDSQFPKARSANRRASRDGAVGIKALIKRGGRGKTSTIPLGVLRRLSERPNRHTHRMGRLPPGHRSSVIREGRSSPPMSPLEPCSTLTRQQSDLLRCTSSLGVEEATISQMAATHTSVQAGGISGYQGMRFNGTNGSLKHTRFSERATAVRLSPSRQDQFDRNAWKEENHSDRLATLGSTRTFLSSDRLNESIGRLYGERKKLEPPRPKIFDDPFFFDLRTPSSAPEVPRYDSREDPHLRSFWATMDRRDRNSKRNVQSPSVAEEPPPSDTKKSPGPRAGVKAGSTPLPKLQQRTPAAVVARGPAASAGPPSSHVKSTASPQKSPKSSKSPANSAGKPQVQKEHDAPQQRPPAAEEDKQPAETPPANAASPSSPASGSEQSYSSASDSGPAAVDEREDSEGYSADDGSRSSRNRSPSAGETGRDTKASDGYTSPRGSDSSDDDDSYSADSED